MAKLQSFNGLYVQEIRKREIEQIAEPLELDTSYKIKHLLQQKYIIYDGTIKTEEEKEDKNKRQIEFVSENRDYPKTRDVIVNAMAMMERVAGEDAEHILRYLELLFEEYDIDIDFEDKSLMSHFFEWVMPGHPPTPSNSQMIDVSQRWPNSKEEPALEYHTLIKKRSLDMPTGFDENRTYRIVSPAEGQVTGVDIDLVEITFNRIESRIRGKNVTIEEMVFTIEGINIASGINEGSRVTKGQQIGTSSNVDIKMTLRTAELEYVRVADYILPPHLRSVLPPWYRTSENTR